MPVFVVTDSFHGTIFSIIFEKEFRNVVNMKRGCARFVDIINKYKSNSLGVFRKKSLDFIRGFISVRRAVVFVMRVEDLFIYCSL